jgi:hypothetical protein
MRMMIRVTMDHEGGSRAIKDGSMMKLMQQTFEDLKPEAAYFGTTGHGHRTAMIFFDMKESSQMPSIAERFFEMKASVELIPVMNREELATGLEALAKKR